MRFLKPFNFFCFFWFVNVVSGSENIFLLIGFSSRLPLKIFEHQIKWSVYWPQTQKYLFPTRPLPVIILYQLKQVIHDGFAALPPTSTLSRELFRSPWYVKYVIFYISNVISLTFCEWILFWTFMIYCKHFNRNAFCSNLQINTCTVHLAWNVVCE